MTSLARSLIERVTKQRDLMLSMSEQTKTISARVTSKDRAVSAEVDGVGNLTGLWLGPPATRLEPTVLAKLIVDTANEAARISTERYAFMMKEFMTRLDELQKAPLARHDGTTVEPE